jgi:hypothetical protein
MGNLIDQVEGAAAAEDAVCPYCHAENREGSLCKHVRWSVAQGDPLAFAHFALETSPYLPGVGHRVSEIPGDWWLSHADWIVEQVVTRFDVRGDYVFGEVVGVDLLARDIWKEYRPDPVHRPLVRH